MTNRLQVVTDEDAFARKVAEHLIVLLGPRLPGMMSAAVTAGDRVLTPAEVRIMKRCRHERVQHALESGELPSTRHPTKGGKLGWFIRAADAANWRPYRDGSIA